MSTYELFYKRHPPHIQPLGATLFVAFRLYGSVPRQVVEALQAPAEAPEREPLSLPCLVQYALLNPVKAGLVEPREDWKWTYCNPEDSLKRLSCCILPERTG